MFKDLFVRVKAANFINEWRFFFENGINPEIYLDGETLKDIDEEEIKKFSKILKKFGSNTIHAPFLDISTGGSDSEIRDLSFNKLKKVMEMGKQWNSYLVVVHYNFDNIYYREYKDMWLKNSSIFFKKLMAYSPPLVAIENIADQTPVMALDLEKRINNNNLIHCFDFGHHRVFGTIPFKEWLLLLSSEKPIHFHFHDNNGSGDDHLPLGEGDICWEEVKSVLSELPNRFTVTLEPHSRADLEKSLKYYREYFL